MANNAEYQAETHARTYDAMTCLEILEYVPDVHRAVAACVAMIKPGRHLFFAP